MPLWALVLFFLVPSVASNCPVGSQYDSYFNKCYQFFSTHLPFLAAEQKCNSIGSHLADIQNAFEDFFVAGQSSNSNFWIGANLLLSNTWTWTAGSSMNYTNWSPGQLGNINACGFVNNQDHSWGSMPCYVQLPFMCSSRPNVTLMGYCPNGPYECPYDSYCSNGYTLNARNCLCYKYINSTYLPFVEANAACGKDGGMLAKITSQDVNDFLTVLPGFQTLYQDIPWIGLNCTSYDANSCSWVDGTPLGNYTNFMTTIIPDPYILYSVITPRGSTDGQWGGTQPGLARSYICQKASTRANLHSKLVK